MIDDIWCIELMQNGVSKIIDINWSGSGTESNTTSRLNEWKHTHPDWDLKVVRFKRSV